MRHTSVEPPLYDPGQEAPIRRNIWTLETILFSDRYLLPSVDYPDPARRLLRASENERPVPSGLVLMNGWQIWGSTSLMRCAKIYRYG